MTCFLLAGHASSLLVVVVFLLFIAFPSLEIIENCAMFHVLLNVRRGRGNKTVTLGLRPTTEGYRRNWDCTNEERWYIEILQMKPWRFVGCGRQIRMLVKKTEADNEQVVSCDIFRMAPGRWESSCVVRDVPTTHGNLILCVLLLGLYEKTGSWHSTVDLDVLQQSAILVR